MKTLATARLGRVEFGSVLGVIHQDLSGGEMLSVHFAVPIHAVDKRLCAVRVDHTERAAAERWEPNAEDGADIADRRRCNDVILQTVCSLVDKARSHAKRDVVGRNVRIGCTLCAVLGNQLLHLGVLLALLGRVKEHALARLATQPVVGDDVVEERVVCSTDPNTEVARQVLAHAGGDINAHLVHQRHGSDGEAVLDKRRVDVLDRGAALQQRQRLVHVRPQTAVDEEAGDVLDDDRDLALLQGDVEGSGSGVVRGAIMADDFNQRHLVHRREVVHAQKAIRTSAGGGKLGNGDGRSVGGEHSVGREHGFEFADHLVLKLQGFKHGFDHHVGLCKLLLPLVVLGGHAHNL
eukprot:m.657581 g.657581  ORF g.657581 m.657581 type:complete len:350 (+) comp22714_c0_seq1:284-1333(+)